MIGKPLRGLVSGLPEDGTLWPAAVVPLPLPLPMTPGSYDVTATSFAYVTTTLNFPYDFDSSPSNLALVEDEARPRSLNL